MRKIFALGTILSLTLISCSDDDSNGQSTPELKLITSSNTTGKISFINLLASSPSAYSFTVNGTDNDGVYYNTTSDEVILASRTNNRLETYSGLKDGFENSLDNLTLSNFSSNTDFTNAREIAVSGNMVVVTQDQAASNSDTNKFFVYQKSASGYSLLNEYTLDFKVWGIHLEGTTLYAIADLTSDLLVFNNFFANATGSISPTKRVTIEGLTRTHGITYSSKDNVMILTDVASAADATDGGLIIINNFTNILGSTSSMGTIAMSNQVRIYGANSTLGNPVDVAYDYVTNMIYVAERANSGGKVLTFSVPTVSGDSAPVNSRIEAGVAAVYLVRK